LSSAELKNQSNIKRTNKLFIRGIEKSKLRTNKLASQNLDLKAVEELCPAMAVGRGGVWEGGWGETERN
jgi:hypothetical protein